MESCCSRARYVRHHEEEKAVRLPRVEHRQDVRMVQVRDDADLAQEPLRLQRPNQLGVQHLDRDHAPVSYIGRQVHSGKATAAQLALYVVAPCKRGAQAIQDSLSAQMACDGGRLSCAAERSSAGSVGDLHWDRLNADRRL
jgi:hypothetical protein